MPIEWIKCDDKMPTERGRHLLYSAKEDAVMGPIPWIPAPAELGVSGGMWVDLFATPEAGQAFGPPTVTHWAQWNAPEGTKSFEMDQKMKEKDNGNS